MCLSSLACTCGNLPTHTTVTVRDASGVVLGEGLRSGSVSRPSLRRGALRDACLEACDVAGADSADCLQTCTREEGPWVIASSDSNAWGLVYHLPVWLLEGML